MLGIRRKEESQNPIRLLCRLRAGYLAESFMPRRQASAAAGSGYARLLLFVAGLGGLLYGTDVGIIAAALLYLSKTISLTLAQTSLIVAAVLGGSMFGSLGAGFLADRLGRKKMMLVSGLMFIASVGVIVSAQGFATLFLGRLLQGMSGGVVAVVAPLYLAESLSARSRGQGTALFQWMLTLGILIAATIGWLYTRRAEAAIAAARGNLLLIRAAQNHAWRGMFLSIVYPGILFFLLSLGLCETPRWLFRKGRTAEARASLLRSCSEEEAETEMREMEALARKTSGPGGSASAGSVLRRKYVIPFLLACGILALNQATGINSILGFLVIILKQAGMNARHATQGDVAVKLINCAVTLIAIALVDRKGRKFLLKIGTAGIVVALAGASAVFWSHEWRRIDLRAEVRSAVAGNSLALPLSQIRAPSGAGAMDLTVLYTYGQGDRIVTARSDDPDPVLRIAPGPGETGSPLRIRRALYGPVAGELAGWVTAGLLGLFIAGYAIGPGVVVWLALSELLPTRIRSVGMGMAMLVNQLVSTSSATLFLPVVGNFGYHTMFSAWAICTVCYFLIAAFVLPETKGKTLEEIELYFEPRSA